MANMYEFRCHAGACYAHWLIKEDEDPTSSSGCCKVCGVKNWSIKETNIDEVEYFKQLLKDPNGTIGYHTERYMTSFGFKTQYNKHD